MRALLTHPTVLQVLKRAVGDDTTVLIQGPRRLRVVVQGELLYRAESVLGLATDLYQALDEAMLGDWRAMPLPSWSGCATTRFVGRCSRSSTATPDPSGLPRR